VVSLGIPREYAGLKDLACMLQSYGSKKLIVSFALLLETENHMSRRSAVGDLDHAYELVLILLNILFGIFLQHTTTEEAESLPPIIANLRRLSIAFVFPVVLTITAWVCIYFVDDENWKMRLRTYAWSSAILLAVLEITVLYVVCLPPNSPDWLFFPMVVIFMLSTLFPVISWWLMRRVMERYRTSLKKLPFFTESGKMGTFKRLLPFGFSLGTFWLAFLLSTLV